VCGKHIAPGSRIRTRGYFGMGAKWKKSQISNNTEVGNVNLENFYFLSSGFSRFEFV
jgi:hypothetical protein